ncbi:MAG: hypothetical protein RBT65_12990 [Methanolobus sp.]|nr:hypothetical protein [Methanolobus sp.]
MSSLGFIIFLIAVVLSISWMVGVRKLAREGGVTQQTVNTSMLFSVFTIYALFADEMWAFNLLWLFPLSWIVGTLSLAFPLSLLWIPGSMYAKVVTLGLRSSNSQAKKDGHPISIVTEIVEYIGDISKESTNKIVSTLEKEHKKISKEKRKQIENVAQFWFVADAARILSNDKSNEMIASQMNWLLKSSYQHHLEEFQKFSKGETPSISDNPMEYVGIQVSKIATGEADPILSMYAVIAFTEYVKVFPEGLLKIIGKK